MDNSIKVAAVVVTYNRKDLLLNCLEALKKQTRPIDSLFIIDNFSDDGTPTNLYDHEYIKKLPPENNETTWINEDYINNPTNGENIKTYYIRMNENVGGAGGFHEGVKQGIEKGYDWLWLMDDDGMPSENALELLVNKVDKGKKQSAISCLVMSNKTKGKFAFSLPVLDEFGNRKIHNQKRYFYNSEELRNYIKNDIYPWANFFNGVMINTLAVKDVGNIKKELFIWGDEQDYMFRLMKWGELVTVIDALHFHPDNNQQEPPLWKMFYGFRNELYLNKKYRSLWLLRFIKSIIVNFSYFYKKKALSEYFRAIKESFKL